MRFAEFDFKIDAPQDGLAMDRNVQVFNSQNVVHASAFLNDAMVKGMDK
jgi:hypothetical protein